MGNLRTQNKLADWVLSNPERQSISKSELSVLYQSRRVGHAALAEAVRDGLLEKSATGEIKVTPKLTQIAGTRLQSGGHTKLENSGTLLMVPVATSLESCSDLVLNQLPKKYRTPRRQNTVSRNRALNARNLDLSTDLSTGSNQFLETTKPPPNSLAPSQANSSELLTEAKSLKSLASLYLEENIHPKDGYFDEEIY